MALNYTEKISLKAYQQQLRDNLNKILIEYYLKKVYKDSNAIVNIREVVDISITPQELNTILIDKFQWALTDIDLNGFNEEIYCYFSHRDYNFGLTVEFNGYTGTLKLYRSDI